MNEATFKPTLQQQQSLCMAYLAYTGELLTGKKQSVEEQILLMIDSTMKKIKPLQNSVFVDWRVVWGPAIYTLKYGELQDNMMFVSRRISEPVNYIVGIRGTNGTAWLDWLEEDLDVLEKVDWKLPAGKTAKGTPKISEATDTGFYALLNKMKPESGLPGSGLDITAFLKTIVKNSKININFTGHSLGGALAPTLALWFKQSQGTASGWDPKGNASISITPFAGATAGNSDFATYSDRILGDSCDRIHNTNDVVPHVWTSKTIKEIPELYSSIGIIPGKLKKWIIDQVADIIIDYKQINNSNPFTFPLNKEYDSFTAQVSYQHVKSYPTYYMVPELITVIDHGGEI